MPVTPNLELPYPVLLDSADVPRDIQALAERLDELFAGQTGAIPGEVKLWPNSSLPERGAYGRWVWADGAVYSVADYPVAASHIAAAWRTFYGAPDPGAGNFRVPDLRGLVPSGTDAMPGGARANRTTRAYAATPGAAGGSEYVTLAESQIPSHTHGVSDPTHTHNVHGVGSTGEPGWGFNNGPRLGVVGVVNEAFSGVWINAAGGGGAHETLQPTVFVPYIVRLDG